jgi:hypothetical protein
MELTDYSPEAREVLSAYSQVILDNPLGYKVELCIAAVLRAAADHCADHLMDRLHLRSVANELDGASPLSESDFNG